MITLRRSSCWVLVGVGSMLPFLPFFLLFFLPFVEACTDKHQIVSAASICEGRVEGFVITDNRSRVREQDHQSWHRREEKADKASSTSSLRRSFERVLIATALGHSRHRTLPLCLTLLLSRRCWRNTSLRYYLPPNLRLPLLLSQRRPRPRFPESHTPPRGQQGRPRR